MYVCICKGITDKQIQDAITARKSNNPQEILEELGVGADCGSCVEEAVKNILKSNTLPSLKNKDGLAKELDS